MSHTKSDNDKNREQWAKFFKNVIGDPLPVTKICAIYIHPETKEKHQLPDGFDNVKVLLHHHIQKDYVIQVQEEYPVHNFLNP